MELTIKDINNKIYTIRGLQVIMDRDLASLYGVETKVFNQAVKRNIERFPENFMFQLTKEEFENLRSQIVTLSSDEKFVHGKHTKYLPHVFTEQGVSMLSAVLRSKTAIDTSIKIINTFVEMRKYLSSNNLIENRLNQIEKKLHLHDDNFEKVFKAIESKDIKPKQGIFFDGEIFDAYKFINDLIKSTKNEIILVDNYVDEITLTIFSKVPNIKVIIYTPSISKQLKLDYEKYKKQYNNLEIKIFKNSHDRFLILDKKELYHIGASLKDLGNKWFAFSKMDIDSIDILNKL